jgi:hypothetical protein
MANSPRFLADLARIGEESLRNHILAQATYAHRKHGALNPHNVGAFLMDRECVRYPTRLVYEFGPMAAHQFAQPDWDSQSPRRGRILYLRPSLSHMPDLAALAVAYMTPVLNYGSVITDQHCVLYGAALQGLMEDEFYEQACAMADLSGCAPSAPGSALDSPGV